MNREEVMALINHYLSYQGAHLTETEFKQPILGLLFDEHDEADDFVGQVLTYYGIRPRGWVNVESFNDLVDYILQQLEEKR
ncbi:hypothetical protein [Thioflexithrix psekupsensis]|uniref:Uncharacterized protein n=1 Tax=Thioflexithrix psekupsensis TaxID=1570016 RepID=A0A251X975_9GAMM|nr:hypothetical protein [Thioflexithrix psekupsensis]OUD14490.1 hypothetical protein TPSD3_09315 [Thioflexithrix psekupsensis]